jgi:hypothetical protein
MVSGRGSRSGDHAVSLNLVRLCAIAAHSIVPSLSGVVLGAFDVHAAIPLWPGQSIAEILDGDGGYAVKPIGRLVEKLSDTDALRLKRRFGDGDNYAACGPRWVKGGGTDPPDSAPAKPQ